MVFTQIQSARSPYFYRSNFLSDLSDEISQIGPKFHNRAQQSNDHEAYRENRGQFDNTWRSIRYAANTGAMFPRHFVKYEPSYIMKAEVPSELVCPYVSSQPKLVTADDFLIHGIE